MIEMLKEAGLTDEEIYCFIDSFFDNIWKGKYKMVHGTKQIENQLFNWTDWDQIDTADFTFYKCTLIQPIGIYPIGTKFAVISVLFRSSQIHLYLTDTQEFPDSKFKLVLNIGDKIND